MRGTPSGQNAGLLEPSAEKEIISPVWTRNDAMGWDATPLGGFI